MSAGFKMRLIEKAFNAVAATVGLVSRIEPTSKTVVENEKARRKSLDETLLYPAVKTMTRSDSEERVRIVQYGRDFGAIVDFHDPKCGWSSELVLAGGIIYESAAVAEKEARAVLAWLKDEKEASA